MHHQHTKNISWWVLSWAQRRPTLHWVNLPEVGLCLVHQCCYKLLNWLRRFWWKACLGRATSLGQSSSPGSPITLQKNHRWTWAWAIVLKLDFSTNSEGWSLGRGLGNSEPQGAHHLSGRTLLCAAPNTVILGRRAISQENYKSHCEETDTITPAAAVKCTNHAETETITKKPETLSRPGSKYSKGTAWAHHVFLYAPDSFFCPDQTLLYWHTFRMLI